MGMNWYLKRKEPRLVYDEYHIAKTSWGWEPHFQGHAAYDDEPDPSYHSVADIKNLYDSGAYDIVNEEGDVVSWEEFDEHVLHWADQYEGDKEISKISSGYGWRDPQGYAFTSEEFC